ncbi:MAG: hypothetical protein WD360_00545 [Nitriliruptoraceae bacterium]
METVELDTANWLLTADATRLCRDVSNELAAGTSALKLAEQLARNTTFSPARRSAVLQLVHVRHKATKRYAHASEMFFTKDALEQLSDPQVAQWRATDLLRRFHAATDDQPQRIVDLCAGVGGDAEYLGRLGVPLTCVEIDPVRAVFLRHNLSVLGTDATISVGDARSVATGSTDAVFADPSRRHNGQRILSLGAYKPPVPVLLERHSQATVVAIAVAPGVDSDDAALPPNTEVTYLDVAGQLTEAVLWGGAARSDSNACATAVLLPEQLTLARTTVLSHAPVNRAIDGWLITMRPAAIRARVHDQLAAQIQGQRLAEHRAVFFTLNRPLPSPWFHARRIAAVCSAQPKQIRQSLAALAERPVEIVLHGADLDITQLWQRLGAPQRGPTGWRIEIIRRDQDTVAVITDAKS